MRKILCFCVCDHAGTDIENLDNNQAKKTKTSTRFRKVSKAEAEEANLKKGHNLSSKFQKWSLKNIKMVKIALG